VDTARLLQAREADARGRWDHAQTASAEVAATGLLDLVDLAADADAAWCTRGDRWTRRLGDPGRRGAPAPLEPVAGDTLADNRTPVGRSFLSASTMIELAS
jgi:hypothetical protein